MNRPSKEEIKARIDALKQKPEGKSHPNEPNAAKIPEKKSSKRIRKQGV